MKSCAARFREYITAAKPLPFAALLVMVIGIQSLVSSAAAQDNSPLPASPEENGTSAAFSERKDDRELNYAVVPGPTYSPSLGWGLMIIPIATFRYDPADKVAPASSLAAFLLFTENDSYVVGMGSKLYLREDVWRISGGAGYGYIKQKFYGIGTADSDEYISMTSEFIMAQAQALYRVWPGVFLGPSIQYRQARYRGDDPDADRVLKVAGLNYDYNSNTIPGIVAQLDTREDQVAPRDGLLVDVKLSFSSESLGSTSSYRRLGAAFNQYLTLWDDSRHVLAWQAAVETGFGEVPFDEYPDLGGQRALRGYVKGEFTDKNMVAAQAEYRWNAWKRLGLTAFFGMGTVFPAWGEIDDTRWLPAGGVGLRYMVIPERRMNARLDLAWGELGFNFYFSVGEAF